ncbi:hypothetical protein JK182_01895 [Acetobacter okinawensis]|uniref:hypothetical protein n=1 Tax=Acetobacter okinawensis TaxID=1076594 RepID=UPI001BAC63F1|nr:hypothetical protein [Acetobacter okinawensis]MBS0987446.1 hypothetical protein [Acetobacter okinawensis]
MGTNRRVRRVVVHDDILCHYQYDQSDVGIVMRRKIFLPFRSVDERDRAMPQILALVQIVFERGVAAAKENRPLPPSFYELFGDRFRDGVLNTAEIQKRAPENFDFMAEGGCLGEHEKMLMELLAEQIGIPVPSDSSFINESMIAGSPSVVSIPNPAMETPLLGDIRGKE